MRPSRAWSKEKKKDEGKEARDRFNSHIQKCNAQRQEEVKNTEQINRGASARKQEE